MSTMPNELPGCVWRNTDPRHDIYRWTTIIILRPTLKGHYQVGMGDAETKHGYSLCTDFDDYPYFDADNKWDSSWWWTTMPAIRETMLNVQTNEKV